MAAATSNSSAAYAAVQIPRRKAAPRPFLRILYARTYFRHGSYPKQLFRCLCGCTNSPVQRPPLAALPPPMRLYKFPGAEAAPSSSSAAYAAVQIPRRRDRPKQPFRCLCACTYPRRRDRPKQPFRCLCGCINFRAQRPPLAALPQPMRLYKFPGA